MKNILKLNDISPVADGIFNENYEYSKTATNPVGIILRSFKMQDYPLNDELLAVARAGAGVNNIPIPKCTEKGIVVFNTPGANANAVKEHVLLAMLMLSRKIPDSIEWCKTLKGKGADVAKLVESGKNEFVGPELYGKKLAVVGLGAIGAMVANAAVSLGMEVYGYDPFLSIDSAWNLSRSIKHVTDFNALISNCDYLTLHIPMTEKTRDLIDKVSISRMKPGVRIVNCARGELVNSKDILAAIKENKVAGYFTDFPDDDLICENKVICIPHLGASTPEAEDNCAYAAAKQLREYIENGNIINSVNFPNCNQPRQGVCRLALIHKNVKNILNQITNLLSEKEINIANLLNNNNGDFAYTIVDLDSDIDMSAIESFKAIDGMIRVRLIR
ncbi:MAG: 3-phosphoglycerate dehydrogenase family protein [Clostridia bacterium]